MKLNSIMLLVLIPVISTAQEDSTLFMKDKKDSALIKENKLEKKFTSPQLPPRLLIIKTKDISEIKNVDRKNFIIIDSLNYYTSDEIASGLSKEELAGYKKNKKEINRLIKPPPNEEETYPTIFTIRKILSIAQTVGCIIILILSL